MRSLCYDVSYMPITLLHAYSSHSYIIYIQCLRHNPLYYLRQEYKIQTGLYIFPVISSLEKNPNKYTIY